MRSTNILGVIVVLIMLVMAWSYGEVMRENEELRNAFSRYEIANGKNYARVNDNMRGLMIIQKDYRVPARLLKSIETHENIGKGFSFGVKKTAPGVQDKYPPELWQAASAAFIIQDEAVQFAMEKHAEDFLVYLGKRYCGWDENWGKSVYKIYCQEKIK